MVLALATASLYFPLPPDHREETTLPFLASLHSSQIDQCFLQEQKRTREKDQDAAEDAHFLSNAFDTENGMIGFLIWATFALTCIIYIGPVVLAVYMIHFRKGKHKPNITPISCMHALFFTSSSPMAFMAVGKVNVITTL